MESFFREAGFTTLTDDEVEIRGIQLFGRVDGDKAGNGTARRMSAEELLADVDGTRPVLVLEHEPREFRQLRENGADMVLCGHTHNGQIFPGNLIIPFFNENAYGVVNIDGMDTVVTAGVGFYGPPMRIGTDSEVTVLHITFEQRN